MCVDVDVDRWKSNPVMLRPIRPVPFRQILGPIPLDATAPTPRRTSANTCPGLVIPNVFFAPDNENDEGGDIDDENEDGGEGDPCMEPAPAETDRFDRHGRRALRGELCTEMSEGDCDGSPRDGVVTGTGADTDSGLDSVGLSFVAGGKASIGFG